MKYSLLFLWTVIVMACCHPIPSAAQPQIDFDNPKIWLSPGLGITFNGGIGGKLNINGQFGNGFAAIRGAVATTGGLGSDEFYDIGLLTGLASMGGKNHFSAATGLAWMSGSRYIEQEGTCLLGCGERQKIDPVVGVPIEIQWSYNFSSFLGMGASGYLNINGEQTFGGLTLSLHLGKLR